MGATARRLYALAKGDIKGRNAAKPARVHISLGHGERLLYLWSGDDSLGFSCLREAQKEEGEEKHDSPSKASDKENLFQLSSCEGSAASCSPPGVCFFA